MSDQLSAIFGRIGAANDAKAYAERLEQGTHKVAILRYRAKSSAKDKDKPEGKKKSIIEVDFYVLESVGPDGQPLHVPGETRGWAWFPDVPDEYAAGKEQGRAKEFISKVGACVGDRRAPELIGVEMAGPQQAARGIVLSVEITPSLDKDGRPRVGKGGKVYMDAKWTPIPQTAEEVAATRGELDKLTSAQPAQAEAPAAPAQATGLGGLGQRG